MHLFLPKQNAYLLVCLQIVFVILCVKVRWTKFTAFLSELQVVTSSKCIPTFFYGVNTSKLSAKLSTVSNEFSDALPGVAVLLHWSFFDRNWRATFSGVCSVRKNVILVSETNIVRI